MKYLLLIAVLLLAGCVEKIEPAVTPGTVYHLPPIEWRVVSEADLVKIYQMSGQTVAENSELHGFVGTKKDGTYVMYTLAPKTIDDDVTTTVGHEVMHVALGQYHK